jgi:molecular chaperone HtpG
VPRTEIKDEEYKQFYQHIAHDYTDPLAWSHNKVEGKREYTSLLYIPGRAPFDLWQRDAARGLKLYVRRVFIMDDAEQFLPQYLRFVKGIVDSSDLPLNVSRELLQQDPEVDAIRSGLTKRVLDMLARLMKDEPEKYATFWKEFGAVLKEGLAQDTANKDKILPLLRFASTHEAADQPTTSLAQYVERMKPGQEKIYYLIAETVAAARSSPYIEQLKEHELEVLLLSERIDEWVMGQLDEFEGKKFKDAARGDLELGSLENEFEKQQREEARKESKGLLKRVKDALGDRVQEVRTSVRLRESPACLVLGEHDMGAAMRRIMAAAGQKVPESKPVLEINTGHTIVKYLDSVSDAGQFNELAQLLYDQASLAEGGQLANPAEYVQRLNRLLARLAGVSDSAAPAVDSAK